MTEKRHFLARIGIVLLNFLAAGLGLLRLGRGRMAAVLYGLALAVLLFIRFGPRAQFPVWAFFMLLAIGVLLFSLGATWRLSRTTDVNQSKWRRWYAIVGFGTVALGINLLLLDKDKIAYRNFYLPAEAMMPTLLKGDRLVAYMRFPKDLHRGDVVLVRYGPDQAYIKRLAGLPGDVIELQHGQVVLNGVPVSQQAVATENVKDLFQAVPARRLREQFPGEANAHEIYDIGESEGDNFGPVRVSPGHFFLLGDNRDRSADSRFPREVHGLEQVAAKDILGEALFYSWGSSRPIGRPIEGTQ